MGRGWGFGLHEAMDQTGAFLGPLLGAGILFVRTNGQADIAGYQLVFALLAVPASLAFLSLLVARILYPHPAHIENKTPKIAVTGFTSGYWLYVLAAGMIGAGYADFQLIAFHVKDAALAADPMIPLLYALAMGTVAIFALPAGWL
jgi:MFS family permease